MAKMNVWKRMFPEEAHEAAAAQKVDAKRELRRTVLTCMLWEDAFYEKGSEIAKRIAEVVRRTGECGGSGARLATRCSFDNRSDGWAGRSRSLTPTSSRTTTATPFLKLCDVLFLCHAKPKDAEQAGVWKKLVENTLEPPDTWEVALSAGKDKRENFERLQREDKLGGMAVPRSLRLMLAAGVEPRLIRERLDKGVARALPFRFVTAARYAPKLEDAIDKAMLKGVAGFEKLAGSTGLVVDVSGSMDSSSSSTNPETRKLSAKSETTRMDAAARLAILLREKAEDFSIATLSDACMELPARRDSLCEMRSCDGRRTRGCT